VPELGHRLPGLVLDPEVEESVAEVGPEEELGGEVADSAARLLVVGLVRRHGSTHDLTPHGHREGEVVVVSRRRLGDAAERGEEGFRELPLHGIDDRPVDHGTLR
jgi:hypothetical protein